MIDVDGLQVVSLHLKKQSFVSPRVPRPSSRLQEGLADNLARELKPLWGSHRPMHVPLRVKGVVVSQR